MSLEKAWNERFPNETPAFIINLMRQTWANLMARNLAEYNSKSKEPILTEGLALNLETLRTINALAGRFSYENPNAVFDETTGEITKRRRTDILYYSSEVGLNLTFEFKKLKPNSKSHKAYCQEGILRFVQGKYSADQPLAFMVGMVEPTHKIACITGIQAAMHKDRTLQILEDFDQPSLLFPQLAEFDSQHTRTSSLSPITLSHLLFVYSELLPTMTGEIT